MIRILPRVKYKETFKTKTDLQGNYLGRYISYVESNSSSFASFHLLFSSISLMPAAAATK
jgi:hypothetical protein